MCVCLCFGCGCMFAVSSCVWMAVCSFVPHYLFIWPAAGRALFNYSAPRQRGGPTPPTHPTLKDWAKLSCGPLANQKLSLEPSWPISLGQIFSLASSVPLQNQHHCGVAGPPPPRPPPLKGALAAGPGGSNMPGSIWTHKEPQKVRAHRGGRPVRIPDPYPPTPSSPPRPPKVFEPVFLQIEILGESVGAKGAIFFLAS